MKTISIQSFKGGTGKTTATANMAYVLNKYHDKKVLVVEADAQSNISSYFGIDKDREKGIADILVGNDVDIYSLVKKTRYDNLHIITKCERKAPKFIYGDISSLKNNDSISLFFIVLYF